ncbi:MAG: MFS transporter [Promethearchaeota archaeon]
MAFFQNYPDEEEHREYLAKYQINPSRAMFTIILSIMVDVFGFSMVMPLLPQIATTLGATALMYGFIISSNAVMILIFGPIWGKLSDKYGRKSILMISQAGTGVAFLLLAFSNSLYIILAGRILDGIFSGQFPIVRAYISDVTTPQTRTSQMSKMMVGYTSGMIIGPLLGGTLGSFGWWVPMVFASLLCVLSVILTYKVLVESMPKDRIADLRTERKQKIESSGKKESIWSKEVGIRFTQVLLHSFISMVFQTGLSLSLYRRYNANPAIIGSIMSITGIVLLVYGLFLIKRAIQKIGEKRIFFLCICGYIVLFLVYPYLAEFWMMYIFMAIYALCMSSIYPLLSSNITKAVGPAKQGELSGWSVNIRSVAQVTSPIISTGFLELGGLNFGLIYFDSYQLIGFTIVILAIVLLIVAVVDVKMYPRLYSYEKALRKRMKESKMATKTQLDIIE